MLSMLRHQGQFRPVLFYFIYKSSPSRLQAACDVPLEFAPLALRCRTGSPPPKKKGLLTLDLEEAAKYVYFYVFLLEKYSLVVGPQDVPKIGTRVRIATLSHPG